MRTRDSPHSIILDESMALDMDRIYEPKNERTQMPLVLGRKPGEEIDIDHGRIVVKVVSISKGGVQLMITAPPDVPIHRKEVVARIKNGETPK